ncbi:MAG: hypothetical protein LBJ38_03005 [Oscillospiraceae bacterium]|nr:hypothetical protein [Oscillospiraceae bacterium]
MKGLLKFFCFLFGLVSICAIIYKLFFEDACYEDRYIYMNSDNDKEE